MTFSLISLSTKFPSMTESRPYYICNNHLSPLCEALTRGQEAAEQDFCANILGAKQHLCWMGGGGKGLAESCTLHNHCSYNLEPNSKDDSEYAVLCSLLRGSTDFFFSGSPWEDVGL